MEARESAEFGVGVSFGRGEREGRFREILDHEGQIPVTRVKLRSH